MLSQKASFVFPNGDIKGVFLFGWKGKEYLLNIQKIYKIY